VFARAYACASAWMDRWMDACVRGPPVTCAWGVSWGCKGNPRCVEGCLCWCARVQAAPTLAGCSPGWQPATCALPAHELPVPCLTPASSPTPSSRHGSHPCMRPRTRRAAPAPVQSACAPPARPHARPPCAPPRRGSLVHAVRPAAGAGARKSSCCPTAPPAWEGPRLLFV